MCATSIAVRVFMKATGGFSRLNRFIPIRFIHPLGPSRELKAVATTIVGKTKGIPVRARRMDFPRYSYRPNRYAPGKPRMRVRKVDNKACPIVKETIRPTYGVINWGGLALLVIIEEGLYANQMIFPNGKK